MSHKHLLFRSEAREKVLRGATAIADAVRVTLGPRARCVLIEKKWGKPIVCNEDDKRGPEAALAARLSVENGASWGLMLNDLNQYFPLEFHGAQDDPVVYGELRRLTSPSPSAP